jgi:hypothetical protein
MVSWKLWTGLSPRAGGGLRVHSQAAKNNVEVWGGGQQANSHFPCRGNARYGFTRQHKQDWGRGGGLPTFSCPHQSPEYQDASGKSQMGNTLM